jgi:hypothetical protein
MKHIQGEPIVKKLATLILFVMLGAVLSACGTNANTTEEATPEVTAEATQTGTETTIRGTVVSFVLGIAFDGNNEITLETEDGQITVLTMEAGFGPVDVPSDVCNKNEAANEVAQGLQAGDEIEVFGLLREDGVLEVCSDARFTITVLSRAEATAEASEEAMAESTETGTESTIRGTIVEVIFGIAFDGNNEIILDTEDGQVTVLVAEAGFVPLEEQANVCNKNQAANDTMQTLGAGDEIEVFGLLRDDGVLAVCSDERFTITVLNQVERTEEAGVFAERPISGRVLENNHDCEVDGICYLLVETADEGEWRVVYGTGERLATGGEALCNVTNEYTQAAWEVEVGAEIEAFGRVRGENEIGLCYEGAYTLVVND